MKISYLLPITQETGIRLTDTNISLKYLSATFESVMKQSIPNWELVVVSEKKLEKKVVGIYNKIAKNYTENNIDNQRENHNPFPNIRFKTVNTSNAAIACNTGLELAKGTYVAVLQAGDQLAEVTSYEVVKCLVDDPKTTFIYTDHDHLDLNGKRFKPFYKPDLSPDLLYCQNYIGNLVIIKKSLLKKLSGWNIKYGSAYDYELNLKAIISLTSLGHPNPKLLVTENPIKHIDKILYHQRVNTSINPKSKHLLQLKPGEIDETKQGIEGLKALKSVFKSNGIKNRVTQLEPKLYRHYWALPKTEPLVSLIIPTRDGYEILKTCIESILKKTTYKNYEILIVDNQSSDQQTVEYIKSLEDHYSNIHILKYNKKFNYSAIINLASKKSQGSIIGLINNDTEVITPEWLTEMVSHAVRVEIGCVGAMLYYPDGTIQHAGVQVDTNGALNHAFNGLMNDPINDNFNCLRSITNPIAVTAAVLLVKKNLFWKVNGFDERKFKIAFNDVDFCLKLSHLGRFNVQLPHVELKHHESKTRAHEGLNGQLMDNKKEFNYLKGKWSDFFKNITNRAHTYSNSKNEPGLIGCIDMVTPNSITGWAYDPDKSDGKTEIIIKLNGVKITTLSPDGFREDLRLLNINNGIAGFNFSPSRKIYRDGDIISAEIKSNGRQLANSPWKFTIDPSTKKWLNRSRRTTPRSLKRLNIFYERKFKKEKLSIIMPAHNSNPKWILEAINSVKIQWCPNWELIIVDDGSSKHSHFKIVYEFLKRDARIKLISSKINKGISASINLGIKAATGKYLTFMDHDDVLEPDAVIHLLRAARKNPDMIYSDEIITGSDIDNILQFAARPAFSYDYYLSHPYFVHMIATKRSIALNVGGWNESMKISADIDFVLKSLAISKTIVHVPAFLYRWRTHGNSTGNRYVKQVETSTIRAINRHLQEIDIPAKAYKNDSFNTYNIKYPKVSGKTLVIIPTKDRVDLLKKCIDSILKTSNIDELKIVVIDHESKQRETLAYLKSIKNFAKVISFKGKFNFSKINNMAVNKFYKNCEYVLFLNNDIEALQRGWIDRLKSLSARVDVGAVGATLIYPNYTIQHSGVIIGLNEIADHAHKFQKYYIPNNQKNPGYLGSLTSTREYSAVTGACLMMKIDIFHKLGGFDESFEIGFNDTDLCLRIRKLGLKVLSSPSATLIHHESLSRKSHSMMEHDSDSRRFKSKWKKLLKSGDEFYNPQLNLLEDHKTNKKISSTQQIRKKNIIAPRLFKIKS